MRKMKNRLQNRELCGKVSVMNVSKVLPIVNWDVNREMEAVTCTYRCREENSPGKGKTCRGHVTRRYWVSCTTERSKWVKQIGQ